MFKTTNNAPIAPTYVARSRVFSEGDEGTTYLVVFDLETRDVRVCLEWDGSTDTADYHKDIIVECKAREGIEYAGIEYAMHRAITNPKFNYFSRNILESLVNEVSTAVDELLGY